jgi:hypothetical protein
MNTPGRRVYPDENGHFIMAPGDYCCDTDGQWWVRPPSPKASMGVISEHTIVEHEDKTISVTPSILMAGVWHGFLIKGEWSEC